MDWDAQEVLHHFILSENRKHLRCQRLIKRVPYGAGGPCICDLDGEGIIVLGAGTRNAEREILPIGSVHVLHAGINAAHLHRLGAVNEWFLGTARGVKGQ